MTLTQRVDLLEKELRILKRGKAALLKDADWIDADDVPNEFPYSTETLRKWRYSGKIKRFRCASTGRKYQYSRRELQKLTVVS